MPRTLDTGALAKEFSSTEFGKWYIAELERRERVHLDLAKGTDAHNLTVNATMRASGVSEALRVLTDNIAINDSGAFKS